MYKFDFDRLYTREEVEDIEGWKFGTGSTYYKHMRILKNAYDVEIVKDDNDHRRKLFHIKNKKKEEETDFRKYNGKEPSIPNDVAFKIWDMYLRKLLNGSNKGRVYFGSTLLGKLFLGINNKRMLYDKLEPLNIPDVIRKKVVDEVYDKAKSLLVDKIMKHHGYSIRSKVLICVPKWETDYDIENYVVGSNYMEELYEEFSEKLDTYNLLFSGEVSNLDIHNAVINDLKRLYPEYRIFFMYHIDYVLDDVANVDITTEEVKLYQSKIRKVIINSIKEKYIKKCSQSIEDIEASIETDIYSYEIAKRIKEINDETLDCICRIEKGFIGSGKAA